MNAHDEDDSPIDQHRLHEPVPNSPPPSFHSRASSPHRHNQVNRDLADAFDDDDDDSEDEADDRQRLVRQNSIPSSTSVNEPASSQPAPSQRQIPTYHAPAASSTTPSGRVVGGGIGTDGVFANMSARPERQETTEKDEQPPVSYIFCALRYSSTYLFSRFPVFLFHNLWNSNANAPASRPTNKPPPTQCPLIGKPRFSPPDLAVLMKSMSMVFPSVQFSPSSGTE